MMNLILVDDPKIHKQLRPLTLTRPVAALRCGTFTIAEKWQHDFQESHVSFQTESYLSVKYAAVTTTDNTFMASHLLPNAALVEAILGLAQNEVLEDINGDFLAKRSENFDAIPTTKKIFKTELKTIQFPWDLFLNNGEQISADFHRITKNRTSQILTDPYNRIYEAANIFVEAGASVKAATLNAEAGPIYIGKNAVIQEGSILIGPVSIGENSMVAWGGKIRPNTTLGPNCRVGGEVGNSIFMANSNKAHDGFLGNSIVGEWCNLGANTNNSNLKNDYSEVKLYSYATEQLDGTGLQFCGTMIGDYTKAGISTMFNTGTVVGVSANVFGADFQPKYIPSFSWGGASSGFEEYRFEKALAVINATMARRNQALTGAEISILGTIFAQTKR